MKKFMAKILSDYRLMGGEVSLEAANENLFQEKFKGDNKYMKIDLRVKQTIETNRICHIFSHQANLIFSHF